MKKSSVEYVVNHMEDIVVVDVRNKDAFERDTIPGAILKKEVEVLLLSKDKPIYILGYTDFQSERLAEQLEQQGFDAYSIEGGYYGYVQYCMNQENEGVHVNRNRAIEKSIIKKFRKEIWRKFTKGITEYELVEPGDKIAVCISGGKDSVLMAKCFVELKRHAKIDFDLEFIVMNPGYNELNYSIILENARLMNIPIHTFESSIFNYVATQDGAPCYLCARMRRGYLYNAAKELGCNKIALGHHYDDVIETILMGMLYGAQVQTMMPKLHSTNFEGLELIRPMYLIREEAIIHWMNYNKLQFIRCACLLTAEDDEKESGSKRKEIKNLIKQLHEVNPYVEANIFKSVENVNLDTVIAYKEDGVKHHFLDTYKEKK